VVTNPHKVHGPETNDLVLQLRKRGIDKVIIAGMSANLCNRIPYARARRLGLRGGRGEGCDGGGAGFRGRRIRGRTRELPVYCACRVDDEGEGGGEPDGDGFSVEVRTTKAQRHKNSTKTLRREEMQPGVAVQFRHHLGEGGRPSRVFSLRWLDGEGDEFGGEAGFGDGEEGHRYGQGEAARADTARVHVGDPLLLVDAGAV